MCSNGESKGVGQLGLDVKVRRSMLSQLREAQLQLHEHESSRNCPMPCLQPIWPAAVSITDVFSTSYAWSDGSDSDYANWDSTPSKPCVYMQANGEWVDSLCSTARTYICEKMASSNILPDRGISGRSQLYGVAVSVSDTAITVSVPGLNNSNVGLLKAIVTVKGIPNMPPRAIANITAAKPMVSSTAFKVAHSKVGNAIEILGTNFGILNTAVRVTLFSRSLLTPKSAGVPTYCADTRLLIETTSDTGTSDFSGQIYAVVTHQSFGASGAPVMVAQFSQESIGDVPVLDTSGMPWTTIATAATGADASAEMRLLSFTNLPDYVKSGDYYVLLEWPATPAPTPAGFAQFHVPEGSNVFSNQADKFIAIDEVHVLVHL